MRNLNLTGTNCTWENVIALHASWVSGCYLSFESHGNQNIQLQSNNLGWMWEKGHTHGVHIFCRNWATLGRSPCDLDSTWLSLVWELSQVTWAGGDRDASHFHAFENQWILSQWNLNWLVCSGFLLSNTSFMQERHINWFLIEQRASNFQNQAVYKMEDARLLLCGIGSQRHGAQGLTLEQFGSWCKHFTGPGEAQLFRFSGLRWKAD